MRDLHFGSLGNGITVYDVNSEIRNDYERVAHISSDRSIKYYVKLNDKDISLIETYVTTKDPSPSYCNWNGCVFNDRVEQYVIIKYTTRRQDCMTYVNKMLYVYQQRSYSDCLDIVDVFKYSNKYSIKIIRFSDLKNILNLIMN